jgi:uncharacterized protein involved in type VI secretion and phage assembly
MSNSSVEDTVAQLAETVRNRYYGKYRGIVVNNDDPENLGRITAQVPEVLQENETPWAMPAFPLAGGDHGLVLIPEVGDGVWIEFEAGDLSRPIWSGCWFARDERPQPDTSNARLLATTAGHKLILDDDNGQVQLVHSGGAEVTMTDSEITLQLGRSKIVISASEININDGMIVVSATGVSLVNDAMRVM